MRFGGKGVMVTLMVAVCVLGFGVATAAADGLSNRFSAALAATGGSGKGYRFAGVHLPGWLTLTNTGLLSGTPTTSAGLPVKVVVTVSDSIKATGTASYALTIDPAVTLGPRTLPVPTMGNAYSEQLSARGGSGTGYAFTAARLPAWLNMSSASVLNGTPTNAIASPLHFTITVADSNAGTASRAPTG